ncbi:hypothetical protein [Granulicella paludicola]|jgi:hypothetical protein|uniref:hypothetical protein n=1 Tax=Granulicella paludicola TaxID=474951 RepID=UPI0021E0C505|nr:hypothetical protein [Granulicella paludicola]
MNAFTVVATIWGIVAVAFIIVMVYRASLANHETDQLFLNDVGTVSSTHQENDEIVRRLNSLAPVCKSLGGVTVLLTLAVAGMWVSSILPK